MRAGGTRAPEGFGAIDTTIRERRGAYVALLSNLVSQGAAGEEHVVRWIAGHLRASGCQVDIVASRAADLPVSDELLHPELIDATVRKSVVGRLPGRRTGRSLLLFCHHDTEPVTGLGAWRHPPFAADEVEGRMIGWGVADDLVGVAILLCALDAVQRSGLPAGSVIAASTPSKRHARGIVAVLRGGYMADAAVYLHPAESGNGLCDIKAVTPGLVRFRVTIHGRPAGTQEPEQTPFHHEAVNPIHTAAEIVRELAALNRQLARDVRHPLIETRGDSVNVLIGHIAAGTPDRAARVPATCALTGSVSFPPGIRPSTIMTRIEQTVMNTTAIESHGGARRPTIEWLVALPGAEVAPGHPLCDAATRAIERVTGVAPAINPLHAGSDIRHPILAGIPCIGFGPRCGNLVQAGGSDEWVDVEDYVRAINVTAHLIVDWCGSGV